MIDLRDFQQVIDTALDTEAIKEVANVIDYIPAGENLPCIIIGEDSAVEYNTKLERGFEITTDIKILTKPRQMQEAKEIINLVVQHLAKDLEKYSFYKMVECEVSTKGVEKIEGRIILNYRVEE